MNTNYRRPRTAPERPADIILAADQADGHAYANRHNHGKNAVIVTPRSIARARGRVGPVYATRKARTNKAYAAMIEVARHAGSTLPRTARDRRVA